MESENNESVKLSKEFVKNIMPNAPAVYTVIYIYALSLENQCDIKTVSAALNISQSDVRAAFMYWQDRGLGELNEESFKSVNNFQNSDVLIQSSCKNIKTRKRYIVNDMQPHYAPEELDMYADKNADVKALFEMAQSKLKRLMTYNDLSSVFSLYHWLGLKMEEIGLLLDFCVERGHRNKRYI